MGTYAYLSGWVDEPVTPEQVAKMKEVLAANDMSRIDVARNGEMYFSGDCGYSFYDDSQTAIHKMAEAVPINCSVEIKMDEADETETMFFGTELYVKMMEYGDAVDRYKSAKRTLEYYEARVTDADKAQWKLERGER